MLTKSKLERINNPREINRVPLAVIGAGSLALGGSLHSLRACHHDDSCLRYRKGHHSRVLKGRSTS